LQNDFVRCAVPYMPELDFGVVYRPATYVSGDIFDIERLDEHHVAVFIADAVGHGVPAGMLTLFISRSLPKLDGFGGSARIVPPGEALARLNTAYCGRTGTNSRFATAMYGVIDTRDMTMRLAGAGHPAGILVREDGRIERAESSGPLLGIFPEATFGELTIDLSDARSLVLFTDGFELAYPDQGEPGGEMHYEANRYEAELMNMARQAGSREGLIAAIERVQTDLDRQIGSLHQADDVTALVIAPRSIGGVSRDAA
jgi:sigma-B regulation protein RsbU (phosphoserine phosphatase)